MSGSVASLVARFERAPVACSHEGSKSRPPPRPRRNVSSPAANALRSILEREDGSKKEGGDGKSDGEGLTIPAPNRPPSLIVQPPRRASAPLIRSGSLSLKPVEEEKAVQEVKEGLSGINEKRPLPTPRRVSLQDAPKSNISSRPPLSSKRTTSSTKSSYAAGAHPLTRSISSGAISTATANVAASEVFHRDAAPLHLPHLDAYLDSLTPPTFPKSDTLMGEDEREAWQQWIDFGRVGADAPNRKGAADHRSTRHQLFPPMHLLPKGVSLADLKRNKRSPPPFFSTSQMLSTAIDAVLGVQGSSYAAAFTSLELFRDLTQTLSLVLPSNGFGEIPIWKKIQLTLALDLVSVYGWALVTLGAFTVIASWLMYEFVSFTGGLRFRVGKRPIKFSEGLEAGDQVEAVRRQRWKDGRFYQTAVTFALTSLYLPLSKICVGAMVWSSDFWPVHNPYLGIDSPSFPPAADGFLDPADFCYRTTMRTSAFNWAYLFLPFVASVVICLTIWFPIRLWRTVERIRPRPDGFTELGEVRRDLDIEYERLLERDESPLAFLYATYRRRWSGFKSIYMAFKLLNMVCLTVLTKDNCLFRDSSRQKIDVVRTGTQLGLMACFLLLQIYASPYLDLFSNASDWISRVTYVLVAGIGLLVALGVPGRAALAGPILLTLTIISYLFNGYFACIGLAFSQTIVKKVTKRLDTSLDLFSPHLDVGKHLARRIYHESMSITLLAETHLRMPLDAKPTFVETPGEAPYLAAFSGTVAERHIECIKIVREIGLERYAAAALEEVSSASSHLCMLQRRITRDYVGPDVFYAPVTPPPPGVTTMFGRCWIVPFPFALLFIYDQSPTLLTLTNEADLDRFVRQQEREDVCLSKRVRMALRALDGRPINAPHVEYTMRHHRLSLPWRRCADYALQSMTRYRRATLRVRRRGGATWRGYNYSSGFDITLSYVDGADSMGNNNVKLVRMNADLGVGDAFSLTPALARILHENRQLVSQRLPAVQTALAEYRAFYRSEASRKASTMSYGFLLNVMGEELTGTELSETLAATEANPIVRALPKRYPASFEALRERMRAVNRSRLHQWWCVLALPGL